jgi:hypothetical protein
MSAREKRKKINSEDKNSPVFMYEKEKITAEKGTE